MKKIPLLVLLLLLVLWGYSRLRPSTICQKNLSDNLSIAILYRPNFETGDMHDVKIRYQGDPWQVYKGAYYTNSDYLPTYGTTPSPRSNVLCEEMKIEKKGENLVIGNKFFSSDGGKTIHDWNHYVYENKRELITQIRQLFGQGALTESGIYIDEDSFKGQVVLVNSGGTGLEDIGKIMKAIDLSVKVDTKNSHNFTIEIIEGSFQENL